ncbi:DUF5677 domain-containing protein [Colwellia sp. E150_009]
MEYSEEYKASIKALEAKIKECAETSHKYEGIPAPEGLHFYASVLFTRMVTISMSILRLANGNSYGAYTIEHWDYASAASLTRNLIDCLNTFLYLCEKGLAKEEWECRWNIFNLHDAITRKKVFEFRGSSQDASDAAAHAEEVKNRLNSNSYFTSLSEKQQKHYLKGADPFLLSKEEIVQRGGGDTQDFLGLYKFLSVQAHSYPMNFYKMGDEERGRGVHSEVEEEYTTLCLELTNSHLEAARIKYNEVWRHENV